MTEIDVASKAFEYGANGLLIGALVLLGRWYLPRLDKMVEALNQIALNLQALRGDVVATKAAIDDTQREIADVKEDMVGIYALLRQPQPSRQRRPASGGAR